MAYAFDRVEPRPRSPEWEQAYGWWLESLTANGGLAEPFVVRARIKVAEGVDAAWPVRIVDFEERDRVPERIRGHQMDAFQIPGYSTWRYRLPEPVDVTRELLLDAADSPLDLHLRLMAAVLRDETCGFDRYANESLEAGFRTAMSPDLPYRSHWFGTTKHTLPRWAGLAVKGWLGDRPLDHPPQATVEDFARRLGEACAIVVRACVLLDVVYGDVADDASLLREAASLHESLRAQREEADRRRAQEEALRAARKAAKDAERAEKLSRRKAALAPGHTVPVPRKPLATFTKDELLKLVWTMSTSDLSLHLGVSDVAIGKRCKVLGIDKPPRGYWARVQFGQEPHPAGTPVLSEAKPRRSVADVKPAGKTGRAEAQA